MHELAEDDRPTLPYGVEERFFATGDAEDDEDDDDATRWWAEQRRRGFTRLVAVAVAVCVALVVIGAVR